MLALTPMPACRQIRLAGKGGGARKPKCLSDCINRQPASRSPHTDPNLRLSISLTALVSSSTQPQPWLRRWL